MMKIFLIVTFMFLETTFFCHNLQSVISSKSIIVCDSAKLIIETVKYNGPAFRDVEKGIYKIFKIDDFSNFYLIFIEKDGITSTIFSAKTVANDTIKFKTLKHESGRKLELDSTYYFELTCKDTLYNGQCLPIIPNVTYFGKYTGFDIKRIKKAKNLYGLFFRF